MQEPLNHEARQLYRHSIIAQGTIDEVALPMKLAVQCSSNCIEDIYDVKIGANVLRGISLSLSTFKH